MNKTSKHQFLSLLEDKFGAEEFTRKQALALGESNDLLKEAYSFVNTNGLKFRVSRGVFSLGANSKRAAKPVVVAQTTQPVQSPLDSTSVVHNFTVESLHASLVPEVDKLFVKHGDFDLISKIVSSNMFYPIFITGLSGNGKTFGVEQACAHHNRELYRVNITIETDEDDLLGGFRLVNDSTKWFDGPVVRAMKSGGVLLLDEVDLGSNKLLCLQPVLEGKGILLKKINQYVRPAPGFTIVATANTKGQGSETGKFVGTNILNEAFLERFPITFEQEYPSAATETKILLNAGADVQFADNLVKWAGVIRKTFFDGGVDEVITTRRLVHIVQAYQIFGDRLDAITKCVNRFDDDTKQSFLELYSKVDAGDEEEQGSPF